MSQFPWLEQYDPEVPAHLDYPSVDLYTHLAAVAARVPSRAALDFLGARITYERLFQAAEALAGALAARGVKAGDRVALLLPNCPQFVISYLALMRLGAAAMLLNPLNVERELIFKFTDSGSRALIALDLLSQRGEPNPQTGGPGPGGLHRLAGLSALSQESPVPPQAGPGQKHAPRSGSPAMGPPMISSTCSSTTPGPPRRPLTPSPWPR